VVVQNGEPEKSEIGCYDEYLDPSVKNDCEHLKFSSFIYFKNLKAMLFLSFIKHYMLIMNTIINIIQFLNFQPRAYIILL